MNKEKVKVLIFGMTSIVGGIETFLMNLYEKINLENLQIYFLVPGTLEDKYKRRIEDRGGKVYEVEKIRKHPVNSIRQLKKIYKENNYDVLHMNLCNAFFFLYALPTIFVGNIKTKIMVHSHNNSDQDKIKHYILRPIMSHYTDKYLACSVDAGMWMFGKKIVQKDKVILVNNSIDSDIYKFNDKTRKKIRNELGIREDEIAIGHIGRFDVQKNHSFLLNIFNEYTRLNKKSKLILVGDGVLKDSIIEKAKKLNQQEKVLFLGIRDNVNELLQACDIFVLPSKFEGFGIVGLEAQASGLYTIVSEKVVRELDVTENIEHINLKEGERVWAEEIENKRKKYIDRENAYQSIKESKFDINYMIKHMQQLYYECAKEE